VTPQQSGQGKGSKEGEETVSGYFRQIFKENPQLLKERSNDELYRRWLADHPGHGTVPDKVKTSLQNVKNVLRAKVKARRAERQAQAGGQPQAPVAAQQSPRPPRRPSGALGAVEQAIDDCLTLARGIDREALRDVIGLLRQARNELVRKAGG
jgi:hypothetical protein